MKKILYLFLTGVLMLSVTCFVTACGNSNGSGGGDSSKVESLETEAEPSSEKSGMLVKVQTPVKNYYGTWSAESAKAENLYGTLEITINDDGTWTGNITDNKLHGTWKEKDFGIHLHDEVLDWESDLFYTDQGYFVLDEDGIEHSGRIVLTKH